MWLAPMYAAVLGRPTDGKPDASAAGPAPAGLARRSADQRSVVRGPADEDMNDWRDAHFAWVIEQQVLEKQHTKRPRRLCHM
jgi:hypothetical protein